MQTLTSRAGIAVAVALVLAGAGLGLKVTRYASANTVDHVGHRRELREALKDIDERLFLYGGGIAESVTYGSA